MIVNQSLQSISKQAVLASSAEDLDPYQQKQGADGRFKKIKQTINYDKINNSGILVDADQSLVFEKDQMQIIDQSLYDEQNQSEQNSQKNTIQVQSIIVNNEYGGPPTRSGPHNVSPSQDVKVKNTDKQIAVRPASGKGSAVASQRQSIDQGKHYKGIELGRGPVANKQSSNDFSFAVGTQSHANNQSQYQEGNDTVQRLLAPEGYRPGSKRNSLGQFQGQNGKGSQLSQGHPISQSMLPKLVGQQSEDLTNISKEQQNLLISYRNQGASGNGSVGASIT